MFNAHRKSDLAEIERCTQALHHSNAKLAAIGRSMAMIEFSPEGIVLDANENFCKTMGYSADEANAAIAAGKLDAVAFGTAFLANPDLPERIRRGVALNAPDPATFYTPGPQGYTDYPTLDEGARG